MKPGDTIEVVSLEWDRSIRRKWFCELIKAEGELIELKGIFERDVEHKTLGLVEKGTVSVEYFWLDRPYNIFAFTEPNGRFRNWYCNVSLPPDLSGNTLSFVDLELDVLIWPSEAPVILDCDELEASARQHLPNRNMKVIAEEGLAKLLSHIELREYPFSISQVLL